MSEHPKVSIIVPIYNVEQYLRRCIDSLLAQTYTNIEIVLVDDGSPDNCGDICDEYAQTDARIKVLHKKNCGLSAARNSGMEAVSGEWVTFIDSDDWLETDAVECLMGLTDGERIEMVMAGYNMANDNSSWCPCVNTQKREVLSRDAALNEMFRPKDYPYLGYVAGKLYRTDLLKNENKRFDESLFYHEDRLFCVSYLCAVRNEVAYTTRPVFNYYQRKGSLMGALSNDYNPKYVTDFYSYLKMLDEVKRIKTKLPVRQMVKTGMCLSYK